MIRTTSAPSGLTLASQRPLYAAPPMSIPPAGNTSTLGDGAREDAARSAIPFAISSLGWKGKKNPGGSGAAGNPSMRTGNCTGAPVLRSEAAYAQTLSKSTGAEALALRRF